MTCCIQKKFLVTVTMATSISVPQRVRKEGACQGAQDHGGAEGTVVHIDALLRICIRILKDFGSGAGFSQGWIPVLV